MVAVASWNCNRINLKMWNVDEHARERVHKNGNRIFVPTVFDGIVCLSELNVVCALTLSVRAHTHNGIIMR